jgi:peptidyl-tRNA hydrolase
MSQLHTTNSGSSDTTTQSVTMFIFVNSDLDLPKGKMAAQVGHIVQLITEEIIRNGFEASGVPESYVDYIKWKQGGAIGTKIIKRASTAELQ